MNDLDWGKAQAERHDYYRRRCNELEAALLAIPDRHDFPVGHDVYTDAIDDWYDRMVEPLLGDTRK